MKIHHNLGALAADMVEIVREAPGDMRAAVRDGVRIGNTLAKDNARRTAGKHGRRYPSAFSSEMRPILRGFGARIIQGEYGPDASKAQGGMSFEGGSRNQKPHRDLAKSADIIGPALAHEVSKLPDKWFRRR